MRKAILDCVELQFEEADKQGKELTPELVHSWASQQTCEGMEEFMKDRFGPHREMVLGTAFFLLLRWYFHDTAAMMWLNGAHPEDVVS